MIGKLFNRMRRRESAAARAERAYDEALLAGWVPPTLAQPAPPPRSSAGRPLEASADSFAEAFLARVYAAQQA
ncbi:MAG TPA: hypothetical protein VIS77_14795 [Burkholderiales bacterium]